MDCLPPLMKQLESDPCVSNSLAQKHDIKVIKIWRPSVEEHFDDIVAPVTIKQVLRNDLSEGVR
jgi:hypothetical protein